MPLRDRLASTNGSAHLRLNLSPAESNQRASPAFALSAQVTRQTPLSPNPMSELDHSLLSDDAEIVAPRAAASSASSSAAPHRSASYIEHPGAAAWTPVQPAAPSMSTRCCARCAPIQKQLGLVSADAHDVSRVWARFASLVLLVAACCFLMLAAAFSRWLNFPGIIALLVLTACVEAITGIVGIVASKRRPISLAEPLSPSTTESALSPAYPRALLVSKWLCTLPLALLCLFFAIWLWMAAAGWISGNVTDLTLNSRRQTTTIILLGICSVVATVAQVRRQRGNASWQAESGQIVVVRRLISFLSRLRCLPSVSSSSLPRACNKPHPPTTPMRIAAGKRSSCRPYTTERMRARWWIAAANWIRPRGHDRDCRQRSTVRFHARGRSRSASFIAASRHSDSHCSRATSSDSMLLPSVSPFTASLFALGTHPLFSRPYRIL